MIQKSSEGAGRRIDINVKRAEYARIGPIAGWGDRTFLVPSIDCDLVAISLWIMNGDICAHGQTVPRLRIVRNAGCVIGRRGFADMTKRSVTVEPACEAFVAD